MNDRNEHKLNQFEPYKIGQIGIQATEGSFRGLSLTYIYCIVVGSVYISCLQQGKRSFIEIFRCCCGFIRCDTDRRCVFQ